MSTCNRLSLETLVSRPILMPKFSPYIVFKIEAFKHDLALPNILILKKPFKTQPQIENEDVAGSPQYNLSATRTNKRRALSLQEMKSDG